MDDLFGIVLSTFLCFGFIIYVAVQIIVMCLEGQVGARIKGLTDEEALEELFEIDGRDDVTMRSWDCEFVDSMMTQEAKTPGFNLSAKQRMIVEQLLEKYE